MTRINTDLNKSGERGVIPPRSLVRIETMPSHLSCKGVISIRSLQSIRALLVLLVLFPVVLKAEPSLSSYDNAYSLEVQGKYKEAIGQYKIAQENLSNRDQWPKAAFRSAQCSWHLDQFKEAADQWETLAKNYANDSLAPEALWMALTTQSGPLEKLSEAIRIAQLLKLRYPRTEYGERGAFTLGVLYYWSEKKSPARTALNQYLEEYRDGKFSESAMNVLAKMEEKQ